MDKTKMLVVVDMQNDFIDGPLGSPEAQAIVPKVCRKIDFWDGYVCYTFDTHYDDYSSTVEGKHIPVTHCVCGEPGWQLNPEIDRRVTDDSFRFYKDTFGAQVLSEAVEDLEIKQIHLVGVCTDICVVSNALLLRSCNPGVEVFVDAACCAGTSPENHEAALAVMESCCVNIINH